jgi:AraC-like DNA-binding protein|tara:strand:+ start:96 stop:494 length:399 start_codon:yes stop_codon:yes gene_type:complete
VNKLTGNIEGKFPDALELKQFIISSETMSQFQKRVRMRLLTIIADGNLSIEALSHDMAMSSRTLQRRLKGEGTSYQNEVNHLREDLARYYLINTSYTGSEIAYLLGYGDANSFFRAFHSWTGQTPRSLRRKH